jgi:hypothetical protein
VVAALDLVLDHGAAIVADWPCWCSDSHLRSQCYIPECPMHTLGPALIQAMADRAKQLAKAGQRP